MQSFSRFIKFSIATSTVLGVGLYSVYDKKYKLNASWTTNYEPSVKWDSNWDK